MEAQYIMNAPVEDIIFENRNKTYGAYDIRKKYNRYVGIATAIAIAGMLVLMFGPLIIEKLIPEAPPPPVEIVTKKEVSLGPPPDLTQTPPPPPPVQIEPPQQIEFTVPEVVEEEVADEPPPTHTETLTQNTGATTEEGPIEEVPVEAPVGNPIQPEEPKPEETFEYVQEYPAYKGGMGALNEFFQKNLKYPDLAFETRLEGTVYVKVRVKSDGSIDKSSVSIGKGLKGGGAGLHDEAIRLVKMIPDGSFTPGKNNGAPVNVWINIPVRFVINDQ
jgi:protein TonB